MCTEFGRSAGHRRAVGLQVDESVTLMSRKYATITVGHVAAAYILRFANAHRGAWLSVRSCVCLIGLRWSAGLAKAGAFATTKVLIPHWTITDVRALASVRIRTHLGNGVFSMCGMWPTNMLYPKCCRRRRRRRRRRTAYEWQTRHSVKP